MRQTGAERRRVLLEVAGGPHAISGQPDRCGLREVLGDLPGPGALAASR